MRYCPRHTARVRRDMGDMVEIGGGETIFWIVMR